MGNIVIKGLEWEPARVSRITKANTQDAASPSGLQYRLVQDTKSEETTVYRGAVQVGKFADWGKAAYEAECDHIRAIANCIAGDT